MNKEDDYGYPISITFTITETSIAGIIRNIRLDDIDNMFIRGTVKFAFAGAEGPYDKEKYKEMVLDAAETVLGFFGFDRTAYSNLKRNKGRKRWYEELREQRAKDIETEMI